MKNRKSPIQVSNLENKKEKNQNYLEKEILLIIGV